MPLKKIDSGVAGPCVSPEHEPPGAMVYAPGTYEWTCPACGEKPVFVVSAVYCANGDAEARPEPGQTTRHCS